MVNGYFVGLDSDLVNGFLIEFGFGYHKSDQDPIRLQAYCAGYILRVQAKFGDININDLNYNTQLLAFFMGTIAHIYFITREPLGTIVHF